MSASKDLDLGWCQGYMGLQYHMEDAYKEKNIVCKTISPNPPVAIFSRNYYNELNELDCKKIYDYCYIGCLSSDYSQRAWVVDFAKKNFTANSIFINTDHIYDNRSWTSLGDFDYTHTNIGFSPRHQKDTQSRDTQFRKIQENLYYFQKMRQSKYVLCPAGDTSWSFRFYETLMSKSLPIVKSWHHTYRTREESEFEYSYLLYNTNDHKVLTDEKYSEMVDNNTRIFEEKHLLH